MSHARTQIRNALETILAAVPTTHGRLNVGRVDPYTFGDLPALAIVMLEETIDYSAGVMSSAPARIVEVAIEATVAQAWDRAMDTLDQICLEVESAVYGGAELSALKCRVLLVSTTITADADGEVPYWVARMLYAIDYHAVEGSPDVMI